MLSNLPNDAVLTRNEVAAALRVTRNWLDHLGRSGRGPKFFKLNRSVRYRVGDVNEWCIACNRTIPTEGS